MAKKKSVKLGFDEKQLSQMLMEERKAGRVHLILRNPRTGVEKHFDLNNPSKAEWIVYDGGKKKK